MTCGSARALLRVVRLLVLSSQPTSWQLLDVVAHWAGKCIYAELAFVSESAIAAELPAVFANELLPMSPFRRINVLPEPFTFKLEPFGRRQVGGPQSTTIAKLCGIRPAVAHAPTVGPEPMSREIFACC